MEVISARTGISGRILTVVANTSPVEQESSGVPPKVQMNSGMPLLASEMEPY